MLQLRRKRGAIAGKPSVKAVARKEFVGDIPTAAIGNVAALCEALGWKQASRAAPRRCLPGPAVDAGAGPEIRLPPGFWRIVGQRGARPSGSRPDRHHAADDAAGALGPMSCNLRRTADRPLFHSLMEEYHYLRYERPVGEHLKYLAWAQGGRWPVWRGVHAAPWRAATTSSAGVATPAAQHPLLAYNTVSDSAVGAVAPGLAHPRPHGPPDMRDWERIYGPDLFSGNLRRPGTIPRDMLPGGELVMVGRTTGRGKDAWTHRPNRSIKEVRSRSIGSFAVTAGGQVNEPPCPEGIPSTSCES
jgi:hypothetical protein